ncbi:hypothetical protein SUGI_1112180 [Cryptomeria japonica]|nr:hypothetical protein SUGI_1112180 [Cryptomeria japonica]
MFTTGYVVHVDGRGKGLNRTCLVFLRTVNILYCFTPSLMKEKCLTFNFLESNTPKGKYEIGRYNIGNCSEESMQKNLLPVLLWLFIDPFILRSSIVICEAAFSGFLGMFQELKLEAGIIEPTKFRLVFNSPISAGCTFFTNEMEDELVFEILAQTQQNTLILMDLGGTHRFMGILGSTLFLFSYLSSNFSLSWARRIFKRDSRRRVESRT